MTESTLFRGFTLFYNNQEAMEGMCYEADAFASRLELPTDDVTIVDCGANIGVFVLLWKSLCSESKVICFEPDPVAFQLLQKNVQANQLKNVQCVNAAVSDCDGKTELFGDLNENGDSRGNSIQAEWGRRDSTTSCTVKTVRLSQFMADQQVAFLKLDVEGCEEKVLRDIEGCLPNVDTMYIEVHETATLTAHNSLARIQQRVIAAGFTYDMDSRPGEYALPPRFADWQAANHAQQSQLFCRRTNRDGKSTDGPELMNRVRQIPRIHIVGRKNAGKTTLVCDLVTQLTQQGYRVATIKHTHHHHELDTPGKDSHKHRESGAAGVGILSSEMTAAFVPVQRDEDESVRYARFNVMFNDCDLIIVEGDLHTTAIKLEVWRSLVEREPYAVDDDAGVVAVVSDENPCVSCAILNRTNVPEIARFVLTLAATKR